MRCKGTSQPMARHRTKSNVALQRVPLAAISGSKLCKHHMENQWDSDDIQILDIGSPDSVGISVSFMLLLSSVSVLVEIISHYCFC